MSDDLEHEYVPQMRHFQSFFLRYRDQPVRLSILQSHFGLLRVLPTDTRPIGAETALQMSEWLHANGDPHAFAWLASELDMGAGDGIVYYLRAHDSLESALEEFSRLASMLLPDGRFAWVTDGARLRIELAPARQATRLGARLRYEAVVTWFIRMLNYVAGTTLPIERIAIMPHEGADPEVLANYLGVTPTIGCDAFVLEYPAEVLKIHLPAASAVLRKAIRPIYDQRLALKHRAHGIVSRVAGWIAKHDNLSEVSLDSAASALSIGASTLRRQLAEQGCKFSALLAARRAQQAMNAIIGSDEKMESLAQRLGYADRNTFERAFRERFDVTPALCRRAARELLSARRLGNWSTPQHWPRHSPQLTRLRQLVADGESDKAAALELFAQDPVPPLRVLAYCAEPVHGAREATVLDTAMLAAIPAGTLVTLVDACMPGAANARSVSVGEVEGAWRCGFLASQAVRLLAEHLAPADGPTLALLAFAHNLGDLALPAKAGCVVEGIDCTWLLLATWHVPPELLRQLRSRHAPTRPAAEALALAIEWAAAAASGEGSAPRDEIEARITARAGRDMRASLASLIPSGAALRESC